MGRQLVVVLDRAERLLIAVEADMPHLGARHQGPNALDHPQAGSEDRHEPEPLVVASGVVTSIGSTRRSAVASTAKRIASSPTSSRNFFGSVAVCRRSASLCATSGCGETCKLDTKSIVPAGSRAPAFEPGKEFRTP